MLTRESAINTANNFLRELRATGRNPSEAWIFGSAVSGKLHEYSDIDLAVWDGSFTGILHIDYERIGKLLVKYKNIELHSFPSGETENENPFISIIRSNGIKIA